MQRMILRDGSRWQPIFPDNGSNELLRLYSDKVIAGYVLSGTPGFVSLSLYAVWQNPLNLSESVIH